MNYFDLGGLIVDYLKTPSALPDVSANIRASASLEWVIKNPLHNSVNVVFFDDVPGAEARRGASQISDQYWLIVVTCRNVSDPGVAVLADAGVLFGGVLRALQGWRPSPQHGELYRRKCLYRKTDRDGYGHIPALFSTRVFTTGIYTP
jgi:hypothetical protein